MGEFPVNPENGPEYIPYDAFQYIAWSVSALPASGTEISGECLSAILAHARLIIKYRRYDAPYLPDMKSTDSYYNRMKPIHQGIMPYKGKHAPVMPDIEQADQEKQGKEKRFRFR